MDLNTMDKLTRYRSAVHGCVALMVAAGVMAASAQANPGPGMDVEDDSGSCTAGFAAADGDGNYYLITAGHCDSGDGSGWTDADQDSLGEIAVSEYDGSDRDAALIQLDPDVGPPTGTIAGRYPVRGVLGADQIQIGMPLCKVGAVSGETCGEVTDLDGNMVEASVFSLHGDSGSPAFVKNADGTVSAVGILSSSPDGDDYTTYFALVGPILDQWGLHILS